MMGSILVLKLKLVKNVLKNVVLVILTVFVKLVLPVLFYIITYAILIVLKVLTNLQMSVYHVILLVHIVMIRQLIVKFVHTDILCKLCKLYLEQLLHILDLVLNNVVMDISQFHKVQQQQIITMDIVNSVILHV